MHYGVRARHSSGQIDSKLNTSSLLHVHTHTHTQKKKKKKKNEISIDVFKVCHTFINHQLPSFPRSFTSFSWS